mgnify:CR=1 FL=1
MPFLHSRSIDWSALTEDFANVQAALGDRIHLRLGMEMGDAQKAPAHMKKLLEDAPQFDFIIGSVHLLSERFGSEDLYLYTPKDQAEAQTALGDYLEEVLALAKLGGFDIAELYRLYPGKPAKKMAYVAGLPKPKGCV